MKRAAKPKASGAVRRVMSGKARIASAWAKAVPPASFRTSEAKEEPGRLPGGLAAISGSPSSVKCGHSFVFGDESADTIRRSRLFQMKLSGAAQDISSLPPRRCQQPAPEGRGLRKLRTRARRGMWDASAAGTACWRADGPQDANGGADMPGLRAPGRRGGAAAGAMSAAHSHFGG